MADPTEYVEVSYKVKFKTKLARKRYYTGMTDEEIIEYVTDPANAAESLVFALQDEGADDMISVKVKFNSDIDEELEEEE